MRRWMGSHRTGLTILWGCIFNSDRVPTELLEGVANCRDFGGKKILASGI